VLFIVVGAVFIVSYSIFVLVPLPRAWDLMFLASFALIWVLFAVDYVVRLALTPRGQRGMFVRSNVIDLLSVVVPLFRGFRVINLLTRVPYFRGRSGTAIRAEIVSYALAYAIFFVYFIALATLQVERRAPGASITTFGDAVWWAIVTLATVGYGDVYPVTALGRIYAVMLMVGGVAIVGTSSALVSSNITERVGKLRNK
jgi:voltage-gated potassium channel